MGEKGDFVRTFYGTGQLLGVRQTDGMHIVAIAQCSGSATAFLQPSAIYQTDLKAMVGLSVKTDFGPGVMVQYRHTDNVYVVELTQGGTSYWHVCVGRAYCCVHPCMHVCSYGHALRLFTSCFISNIAGHLSPPIIPPATTRIYKSLHAYPYSHTSTQAVLICKRRLSLMSLLVLWCLTCSPWRAGAPSRARPARRASAFACKGNPSQITAHM